MLLQEKPCLILLALIPNRRLIVSDLMRHARTTFSHATNLVVELEARGLVTTFSEGRVKYVQATPLGRRVARALRAVTAAGDPGSVATEVRRLTRRARRFSEDWDAAGPRGEDAARLRGRLRRLSSSMEALDCQLRAAGIDGGVDGLGELRQALEALRTKAAAEGKGSGREGH